MTRKILKPCLLGLLIFANLPIRSVWSADELTYPELAVAPRASERLRIEAGNERRSRLLVHLPIQASATVTLATALLLSSNLDISKDPGKQAPTLGLLVGGGWLAGTVALSAFYLPYSSNYDEIKGMPVAQTRDQLTRERLSEEAFQRAARLGKVMRWAAGLSNLGTSVFMLSKADNQTIAFPASAVSVIASFAPLVFPHTWEQIWNQQYEYKKKIYSLRAQPGLLPSATAQAKLELAPGLLISLAW